MCGMQHPVAAILLANRVQRDNQLESGTLGMCVTSLAKKSPKVSVGVIVLRGGACVSQQLFSFCLARRVDGVLVAIF
uniref:Secreted protein n=1 Tax=Ascaris lumbricoides TaxID=6252 RepID=A0A0M3HYL0_ASCLU